MALDATTPAVTPARAGGLRRLLHSPFFWAALAGVITIPAIRPLTRHVPAPPPVLGRLPAVSLVDSRGAAVGLEQLRGAVHVVGLIPAGDDDAGRRRDLFAALRTLGARYARAGVPVRLASGRFRPGGGDAPRLALVDGRGNLRGLYGTAEPGLDEVYHRSLHVLKEARGR